MDRRSFCGILAGAAAAQGQSVRRPNIVFILADDLGYGDLGCYGQRQIQTPAIDQLAREGTRFTDAYAGAAVCAPSRCALMTGMHTGHCRVRGNFGAGGARVPLRPDDITVAEVLKTAGYRTGIFGKWGLGEAGTLGIPNCQGFDEWFGFLNQDHALQYYPESIWENQTEIFPPGNQGAKRKDYAQDLITERILRFIEQSRNGPFFLYAAYTVPHANSELSRDTGDGYTVPNYEPYTDRDWPKPEKGYAAMVTRLDRDVGKIVAKLHEAGLDSNTIVFFTSDNGPATEGTHTPKFFSSGGPLRAGKSSLYEGGIRVPMIARWPGQVAASRVSAEPWAFWDFLPTAADLAGVPAPKGIDGISMRPALLEHGKAKEREFLYWESHEKGFSQAARIGNWKALRRGTHSAPIELYDLAKDIGETHDVSAAEPQTVARAREILNSAHTDSADYPVREPRRSRQEKTSP